MKRLAITIGILLIAHRAAAQSHADVVGVIKNQLLMSGASLSTPCGALAITREVARALAAEQAGLLDKPTGNNCDGFAVDIIVYPDGRAFDILTDSGGSNGPAWQPIAPVDPSRYRAVSSSVPAPVPPPVSPPPISVDLAAVLAQLHELARQQATLATKLETMDAEDRADSAELKGQLKAHDESPSYFVKIFGNRYVQLVLAAVATYVTEHQLTK